MHCLLHRSDRQTDRQWGNALPASASPLACAAAQNNHLSQDGKVWLMCGQGKHDQISVQAIQAVLGVGVPPRPVALLPNVPHHLVFPFSWHVGVRQDDLLMHANIWMRTESRFCCLVACMMAVQDTML